MLARSIAATVFALWLWASPAAGQPVVVDRSADDLLLLEVRLGRRVLSDGVAAYAYSDGVLVAMGELTAALEFAIEVEPGEGRAQGWFLSETRRFDLDVARRKVWLDGRQTAFDGQQVELHRDDIYVDTRLLGRWFPVDLEVDFAALVLRVRSREKLPLELHLERQSRWQRLRRPGRGASDLPRLELPYRLLGWPLLEAEMGFELRRSGAGDVGFEPRLSLLASGDLLRLSAQLFLQAGGDRPEARLRLGRRDAEGRLLGPLRATEFALGDLFAPDHLLVSGGGTGRGLGISNLPLDRSESLGRTRFEGHLPSGWEVELYRNEVLLDYQVVGDDGRYELPDVPLLVGSNFFRLVQYGPQGQVLEQRRRIQTDEGLLEPGRSHYRLAVQRQERPASEESAAAAHGPVDPVAGQRLFASFEHGLAPGLSMAASWQRLELQDGPHRYAGLGLRGQAAGVFASADGVWDAAGGWALRGSAETRLAGLHLAAEMERYEEFVSERLPAADDPLRGRSALRLDGRLPVGPRRPWTFNLGWAREERLSGARRDRFSSRLSASQGQVRWSKILQVERSQGSADGAGKTLGGGLLISSRPGRRSLRGSLGYRLRPRTELTDIALTNEWRFGRHRSLRAELRRSLRRESMTALRLRANWRFSAFALSLNAGVLNRGWSLGTSLAFSLRRNDSEGSWRFSGERLQGQGVASLKTFLDTNANGRWDAGEEPISGAAFEVAGGRRPQRTDERGEAFLTGLPLDRPVDLELVEGSLEDPYWSASRPGVRLVPRIGRVAQIELPVVVTGEVDGTIYRLDRGERRPVARLPLELVDSAGEVVARVRSAYDGFYLFQGVSPGRWQVRIPPAEVSSHGLTPPPARGVTVGPAGEVVSGVDFLLLAR